jgi:glycosyltransferase involved in cell wall biosynthesis
MNEKNTEQRIIVQEIRDKNSSSHDHKKEREKNNNKSKKILFVSLSTKKTIQNHIHASILEKLQQQFAQVIVFCQGEKKVIQDNGITYFSGNIANWNTYTRKIPRMDYIYINDFFLGGAFGVRLKKKMGAKLIFRCGSPWKYHINSPATLLKTGIVQITKPFVIKNCNKVIYNSKSIAQIKYKHNFSIVHNGVDIQRFSPKEIQSKIEDIENRSNKEMKKKFKVLFLGRVIKEKGLDYLFPAIQEIKEQVHLGIVSDGALKEYYMKKYPFAQFYGKVPNSQLPKIINEYDVMVLPALYNSSESFPNFLVEAMACAKPIIGTTVWGIPEMIEHGKNGLLVPQKDAKAIKRAILLVKNNPELAKQLGENGRKMAQQHFEKQRQIEKLYTTFFKES